MSKSAFSIRPQNSKRKGITGYVADPSLAPPDKLSAPSLNCIINENGEVEQRLGFQTVDIDLGLSGKSARSFYMEKYDITIFTAGSSVKYYDWNTRAVYDTGLTLTDGTITRGDQWMGDMYITNTTDGMRRLVFFRLRGAATAGAVTLNIDYDGAARLERFSVTTGNIIIQGTTEAFSLVSTSSGNMTVTALTKGYDDNSVAVVVHDISGTSGIEKASKVFFWKRRLGMFGFEIANNSDQPNNTIAYGKFSSTTTIEDIISFPYNAGGSVSELVGNYGRVTNVIPVKDYLYQFTDSEAYVTAASDIVISGTGIGITTPDLRDERYGCLNEDSATSLGNNEISYITKDKRFMRIRIASNAGAPVVFPDESFDLPLRNDLKNMSEDQTGAMAYHYRGGRQTIFQVKIGGQWFWYIYDHKIGDWQPPQQVICASSFFERLGVLYATDSSDDTVYSIQTSFDDDGSAISCTIATGEFVLGDAMVKEVTASGVISQAAVVKMRAYVTNMRTGQRSGSLKTIDGANFTYSEDKSVGAVPVGGASSTPITALIARWKATFDVFPSEGNTVQFVTTQEVEGGYFRLSSYAITGATFSNSFTAAL